MSSPLFLGMLNGRLLLGGMVQVFSEVVQAGVDGVRLNSVNLATALHRIAKTVSPLLPRALRPAPRHARCVPIQSHLQN
jgi:hypothetical protein